MDQWIVLTEQNWTFWVAGLFALFEFFRHAYGGVEWLAKTFGIETKRMREAKEWQDRLKKAEADIEEIKNTSKRNVDMFLQHEQQVVNKFTGIRDEIVIELNRIHDKVDEQTKEMKKNQKDNAETDCAMLRDRLNSAMRYFSQNKDKQGNIHISLTDYETLDDLFKKYFANGGNGPFERMYNDEFKHFIIDR